MRSWGSTTGRSRPISSISPSIPGSCRRLLFAGHNKFTLTDEVRAESSPATSWTAARSSATPAAAGRILPNRSAERWRPFSPSRPLRKMLPEEPIYSPYYKLGQFTYKKADGSTYAAEPCLESIDFGCRTRRDLLALRSDLRLGRPRASPRPARGDRPGPAARRQHDHVRPGQLSSWAGSSAPRRSITRPATPAATTSSSPTPVGRKRNRPAMVRRTGNTLSSC